MPRHSEATLAAIKNAVDIVALVGEYLPLHPLRFEVQGIVSVSRRPQPVAGTEPRAPVVQVLELRGGRRRVRFREGLRTRRISPRRCGCWPNGPGSL